MILILFQYPHFLLIYKPNRAGSCRSHSQYKYDNSLILTNLGADIIARLIPHYFRYIGKVPGYNPWFEGLKLRSYPIKDVLNFKTSAALKEVGRVH